MTEQQQQQQSAQEEWRLCADWLLRCLRDSPEIQQQAESVLLAPDASVKHLLSAMKDGVLLCHILPTLSSGGVTVGQLSGFKLMTLNSTFAFKQNLQAFLDQLRGHFGLPSEQLFEPEDLVDQENIEQILHCLSSLSQCPKAKASGVEGFRLRRSQLASEYYNLVARQPSPPPQQTPQSPMSHAWLYMHLSEAVYETVVNCRPKAEASSSNNASQSSKNVIKEIIDTERVYVQVLKLLVEDVMRPLQSGKSAWTDAELKAIFQLLPELLSLHRKLLRDLEVNSSDQRLPQVFIKHKNGLLVYGRYCANMTNSQKLLEEACRADRRKQEQLQQRLVAASAQQNLHGLLLVPMQRVLKYHLLLESLLKFQKRDGCNVADLAEAHEQMRDVATFINETKRDTEMMSLIDDIEAKVSSLDLPGGLRLRDYGRLLLDGELQVSQDPAKPLAGSRHRSCFLWTRMLMFTKVKEGRNSFRHALAVRASLIAKPLELPTRLVNEKWTWPLLVTDLASPDTVHLVLLARSSDDRDRWLQALQKARDCAAPPHYNEFGHHFELSNLTPPANCTVCRKLIHGCFFQGYKCRRTGATVHRECIPDQPLQLETDGG